MQNKHIKYCFLTILPIFLFCCTRDVPTTTDSTEFITTENETVVENAIVPIITNSSTKHNIIIKNGNTYSEVILRCEASPSSDNHTLSYQWYKGTPEEYILISGANNNSYTAAPPSGKGITYYFCKVTGTIPDNNDGGIKSAYATCIFSVAYTGLPLVTVTTPDNTEITSKEDWLEDATISISGAENESWNFEPIKTSIRGRGNTTWGQPKKPYALKLDKKQKIMGMQKHKRWVLIANYLDNSFIRNSMAFYLSDIFGLDYTVKGEFVDLVLNGEYKGLYWLGEAIKVDENRINIDDGNNNMSDSDDKDYLLEMDVYYDEPARFKSSIKKLPYMIKNDDYMIDDNKELTSGGHARIGRLMTKINNIENLLYPDFEEGMNTNECSAPDEDYADIFDIDSWAKFWFVNELVDNGEIGHPKSCYFTYESSTDTFKAGPVWDFDWAVLSTSNPVRLNNTIYYDALFKSPSFTDRVKEIWNEKSADIDINSIIEELRTQLAVAAQYDAELWAVNHNPVGIVYDDFNGHVDFLKEALNHKYQVVQEDIAALE